MALAIHWPRLAGFLPLPHPLSVTARLLAAKLLAPLAGPIPLARLTPRPDPRRLNASSTTVPRERVPRRKPLLAPLQQTNPRPSVGRNLPPRPRAIMLDMDQGSANSRRSSPGSGASTLLRSGTPWTGHLLLAHSWSSLITPLAILHPFLGPPFLLAPISPRFPRARFGPLIPRNWPPLSPRLTST